MVKYIRAGKGKMNRQIGKINKRVIKLLDLNYEEELHIFLGNSNIDHMKRRHNNDYQKYGKYIIEIIANPTYIAKNPNQGSIEYIKEYKINNEFVLVAVRISNKGTAFAKTLFTMTERKKNIFKKWICKKILSICL